MDDNNLSHKARIKLLEIEKQKKVRAKLNDLNNRGLADSGPGLSEIGLIEVEFNLRKELLEQEDTNLIQKPISFISNRPPLFRRKAKVLNQWKLEQLFQGDIDYLPYITIAKRMGLIRKNNQFKDSTKQHILEIKQTFNITAIKGWSKKLVASKNPAMPGLKLVPIN